MMVDFLESDHLIEFLLILIFLRKAFLLSPWYEILSTVNKHPLF